MPKAVWWAIISGLATVAIAALQTMGANWIWTPVVIGLIGVIVKAAEIWFSERAEQEQVSRAAFSVEYTPQESWARKVLW